MKNIDKRRFRMRKPPLPAKNIPFHLGKMMSEAIAARAIIAITIHIMVSTVFFFAISTCFFTKINQLNDSIESERFYPILHDENYDVNIPSLVVVGFIVKDGHSPIKLLREYHPYHLVSERHGR